MKKNEEKKMPDASRKRTEAHPLIETKIAPGLPVYVRAVSVDPNTSEIVYLDMTGPHESIQASLAVLRQSKRYLSIAQTSVKLNKNTSIVLRKTLPTRQVNVIILHKQTVPASLTHREGYAYVTDTRNTNYYDQDENGDPIMPERFMDVLMSFITTPMRREWEEDVWKLANNHRLVNRPPSWTMKNMRLFKISANEDKWKILYKRLIPEKVTF
jgi:hypothetical protein